ncbi:hypothetical protein C9I56_40040 [Paraburkholderia caribensis]|nr:hypothetical protein C9I56_40040 [Paraburkholderia caribensis]
MFFTALGNALRNVAIATAGFCSRCTDNASVKSRVRFRSPDQDAASHLTERSPSLQRKRKSGR